MSKFSKQQMLNRAHRRVRKKIEGCEERPRLAAHKSGKHIYVQVIDDVSGRTLVAASSTEESIKKKLSSGANCQAATLVGKLIADKANQKKIKQVVFDRGGHLYHGRIKALAKAAREAGLEF